MGRRGPKPEAGAGGRGQQRDLEQLTVGDLDCRGPLGFRNLPWNIYPAASVPPHRPLSFLTRSRCPKRPAQFPSMFLPGAWVVSVLSQAPADNCFL